jgi:protein-disulfide isomerase
MTYGSADGQPGIPAAGGSQPGGAQPGGNQRRDEAREKAKSIREQHRKQEKKTRAIIQSTVILFAVAIVGIVVIILMNSIRPVGPGPLNMRSDGILIGEGFVAAQTAATKAGQDPIATVRDDESATIAIDMYVDYFCKICGAFEEANGDQIATWVESGAATVEIHPLAILDRVSQGTKYSTRSANAAACVANYSPDAYFAFHSALFSNRPDENTAGLSDEKLIDLVTTSKATKVASISDCITSQKFKVWVTEAKDRALTGPIPNANIDAVTSTPTIIVNGVKYTGAANDAAAFSKFVVQAAGTAFNEDAVPSPSPSPSVTPAP